jgi:hypothetical protein
LRPPRLWTSEPEGCRPRLGRVGLIVSASLVSRFRDPTSAHPTERPPMSVKSTGLSSLGCFRFRAPSHRDPPGCSLEPRHFPTGGFIPRDQSRLDPFRDGTRDLCCSGVSSPPCSASRLVAERSLLAVGVCVTHLVSQAAMAPILDFEVLFRIGDAGFRSWCYPRIGSRSPLQVLPSPGTRISLSGPVDRSRRLLPLLALVLRTLTPPKRSPRSDSLAYSVLRGRWFGARLRDLPPHSRFRAFDPRSLLSPW